MLPVEAAHVTAPLPDQDAQTSTQDPLQPANATHSDLTAAQVASAPPTLANGLDIRHFTDGYMQHIARAEQEYFSKYAPLAADAAAPQLQSLALELPPSYKPWYLQMRDGAPPHPWVGGMAPQYDATLVHDARAGAPTPQNPVMSPNASSSEKHAQGTATLTSMTPSTSYAPPRPAEAACYTSLGRSEDNVMEAMDLDAPYAAPLHTAAPVPLPSISAPATQPMPVYSQHSSIAHALGPVPAYHPAHAPPSAPPQAPLSTAQTSGATFQAPHAPQYHPPPAPAPQPTAPAPAQQAADPPAQPTYTMYGELKVLDEPAGGWPTRYGIGYDSLFRGLAPSKKDVWRHFTPQTHLLVQVAKQTDFFKELSFIKATKALIFRFLCEVTGESAFIIISPDKEDDKRQDGVFPTAWFAYKLTLQGLARARARLVWHTEEGTYFIPETYTGASPYIGSYRGFGNPDVDSIRKAVIDCYKRPDIIDHLTKVLRDDDGARTGFDYRALALSVLESFEVKAYQERIGDKKEGTVIASVYRSPPVSQASHGAWYLWTRTLTSIPISGGYVDGTGWPATAKQCTLCHGGDHDFWNCPFREIPGFHGNLKLNHSEHGANWSTEAPGELPGQGQEEPAPQGPRVVYYKPDTRPTYNDQPRTRPPASASRRQDWAEDTRNDSRHDNRRRQRSQPQQQHQQNNARAGPSRRNRPPAYDEVEDGSYWQEYHPPQYENDRGYHAQPQQRQTHQGRRMQMQRDHDYPYGGN